ncbi:AraC family transcriptional regulator [Priestia megaterium]|uniref:AraC family transcriptional regulator n=1 Tax=Priestia megaterium TaxID=1404 RepID=UPI000BF652AF|nr:AraC family transcriptional regulator [Priestia megaterium]MED4234855.1 AraC family transcriptional regulator [Priestia megaterium]PFE28490.1 AraC family transcriptional regulator [Priestia megaterium]
MSLDLMNELLKITEEEEIILQDNKKVKKDIYTNQSNFVIESEKFLNQDNMIMIRKHTRFVDFPKHKHNYIEINYVYNGELNQKVGNQKISLQQGELLFLNQHIEHEIQACSEEDIIINFIIQPKFFDFIFSFLTTENRISNFLINSLYNSTQNGQFLYFKVSEVESIQDLIKRIIIEIMSPAFMSESTIKLYMGLLMVELIKHADKAEHTEDYPVQHYLIVESLKYIDQHFQSASLYELASKLNQPDYALSKEIKKATNYTFKELLQEKRLIKAKELLESTDIPIASVIDQVGYDNVSYFYRIFKNKYNQTPKQFREHLVKK